MIKPVAPTVGRWPVIYKVLDHDGKPCHGGTGVWNLPRGKRPGKWMPMIDNRRGYHVCDGTRDLLKWLGLVIWEAEIRGDTIRVDDTTVAAQARLLRRVDAWNERTARLFAADCADDVLPIYEWFYPDDDRPRSAIAVARAYANGECDDAAWAAVRNAARDAVRIAGGDAAWAAAWAAAGAPVGAARAAARNVARDAAWAAAWAAAGAVGDARNAARNAIRNAPGAAAGNAMRQAALAAAENRQAERLARYLEGTSL